MKAAGNTKINFAIGGFENIRTRPMTYKLGGTDRPNMIVKANIDIKSILNPVPQK